LVESQELLAFHPLTLFSDFMTKASQCRIARSLEIFSRTFCCVVIIEILLYAYLQHFLVIVVQHMFSKYFAE